MRGARASDGLSGSLDAVRVVRFAEFGGACVMFNISPRFLLGARQSFDKYGMFRALQTLFQPSVNLVLVTRDQRSDIQPQSGKDAAADDTVRARLQFDIVPLFEGKPMNLRIH